MAGSKKQVFYIHGGTSFSSQKKFLEWLKSNNRIALPGDEEVKRWSHSFRDDLGKNFEVFTPDMPNKQNARYIEWKTWFERYFEYLHKDIVLVGWSRGAYFLVKYLIENDFPVKIKALVLIAPVWSTDLVPIDHYEDGEDFQFDVKKVPELQNKTSHITIFHSKDDKMVPFVHGQKYADTLPGAEFITYEDKNHFLIEEFPELIAKIKALT